MAHGSEREMNEAQEERQDGWPRKLEDRVLPTLNVMAEDKDYADAQFFGAEHMDTVRGGDWHSDLMQLSAAHRLLKQAAVTSTPAPEQELPQGIEQCIHDGCKGCIESERFVDALKTKVEALEARVRILTEKLEGKWISVNNPPNLPSERKVGRDD